MVSPFFKFRTRFLAFSFVTGGGFTDVDDSSTGKGNDDFG